MAIDSQKIRDYIHALDLTGTPRSLLAQDAATEASAVFEAAKNQAQVVGAELLAFQEGVPVDVRESIANSTLLAQLVANKDTDAETDPIQWFRKFATVLANTGWNSEEGGWTDYSAAGAAADVHQKVLELLPVLLGPAPGALAVLTAALTALRGMNSESSWIKIFSRETQRAKLARFQVGLVDATPTGTPRLALLACLVKSESTLTRVLFFKYKAENASFEASTNKLFIDRSTLNDLAQPIRLKLRAYQSDYLSSIQDLG